MKINSTQSTSKISKGSKAKKSSSTSGASFSSMIDQTGEASSAENATGISAASSIAGVFAVQELEPSTEGTKKKAVARAQDILEDLEEIKMGILSGGLSTAVLKNLTERLKQQQETTEDAALQEIIAEVELRALVELAKRGIILDD